VHQTRTTPALAGLLLLMAGPGLAQDVPVGEPPAATFAATRRVMPSRPFSVALVGAADQGGPSLGFRGGLGMPLADLVRLDLVVTATGGTTSAHGTPATLWRLTAEARVGYRSGGLLPWLGAGWQASHLIDDREQACVPLTELCVEVAPSEYARSRSGPVISAGVLVALDAKFVVGVEVRRAFLDRGAAAVPGAPGNLGNPGDFGGFGVLLSIGWWGGAEYPAR